MNSNISVTFTEAKEKKNCLIIYDQRLVFSEGDMERLLEFALGVEGGSFLVKRKTFRNGQGFVVPLLYRLISSEDTLHGKTEEHEIYIIISPLNSHQPLPCLTFLLNLNSKIAALSNAV